MDKQNLWGNAFPVFLFFLISNLAPKKTFHYPHFPPPGEMDLARKRGFRGEKYFFYFGAPRGGGTCFGVREGGRAMGGYGKGKGRGDGDWGWGWVRGKGEKRVWYWCLSIFGCLVLLVLFYF